MYVETPLIRSRYLGDNVLLKLENNHPAGSFKARGMTHMVQYAVSENPNAVFYSSSGGNAGVAAAEAAAEAGRPCVVVVPEPSFDHVVERIKTFGAKVIKHGPFWYDADQHLRTLMAKDPNAVYLHPYEGERLWDGHSTLVDELVKQMPKGEKPGGIVVAVGGGGLFAGVARGLIKHGWQDVPIFAAETELANSFAQAMKAGHVVKLESPRSIARNLGASDIAQEAFDLAQKTKSTSVQVTDDEAVDAVGKFLDHHRILVEPSCGAALSAVYDGKIAIPADSGPLVVVICGGIGWTIADQEAYIAERVAKA